MGSFLSAHNRSQNLDFGPLRQLHDFVHHLVHRLLADFPAAHRTMRDADAGVQQAQVVIDFGDGAHCGTWVFRGGLLVDGDCRRQTGDFVHIRFFHHSQKLAGIGRKAFHIPALSVCVDGIEGKGGFSRAGKSRKNDQLVAWNLQINILEVVLPCTMYNNFIVHPVLLRVCC